MTDVAVQGRGRTNFQWLGALNTEFFIRPGTLDEAIVGEQLGTYGILPLADAVVLDIGGCIGSFALFAVSQGAKHVTSYEPEPDNARLARLNTAKYPVTVVEAAIGPRDDTASLYVNGKTNKGLHTLVPVRGREAITVQVRSLVTVLDEVRPSVLKIDIEGGEYALDALQCLPSYVTALSLELHLTRDGTRQAAAALVRSIESQQFTSLRSPNLTSKSWEEIGVWTRPAEIPPLLAHAITRRRDLLSLPGQTERAAASTSLCPPPSGYMRWTCHAFASTHTHA